MYIDGRILPPHISTLTGLGMVKVELIAPDQQVEIGSQQWDDGSRDQYILASLDEPRVRPIEDKRPWPQNMRPLGRTPLPARFVIVQTGTFAGKPATPTVYARREDISPHIAPPAPALAPDQARVLKAIDCLNSRGRKDWRERNRVSDAAWLAACRALESQGLVKLTKTGSASITISGRNVADTLPNNLAW